MNYSVKCDLCTRKFKSALTLKKHRFEKHGRSGFGVYIPKFFDVDGNPAEIPHPTPLPSRRKDAYKTWLPVVVERVNGAHHPKFEGKFIKCYYFVVIEVQQAD